MTSARLRLRRRHGFASAKVLLICAAVLAPASIVAEAEIIDRVLAVAAGQVIMQSDVTAARDLGRATAESADPIGEILRQLIDRALVLAEVERYAPPEPDEAAIVREVEAIRARTARIGDYDALLARSGIDERHVRQLVREDLRMEAYLAQRFTIAPPTDEEVARFYRDNAQLFPGGLEPTSSPSARAAVVEAAVAARRRTIVADWVAGLRRRAEVVNLWEPPAR
jgi:hypothetical protein